MRSSRSHVLAAKLLCLWVLLLLYLMPAAVIAAAMRVKVIDLHYTTAEKIIPLIAPMLVEDGSVSGEGNTLVLKTTYRNLTEIRYLIQRIDKRPVALLVSIRQADKRWNSEASQLSQKSTVYQTDIPFEQNLKLLEGEVAFIDTSRQYPVVTLAGGGLWASENFRGGNFHGEKIVVENFVVEISEVEFSVG